MPETSIRFRASLAVIGLLRRYRWLESIARRFRGEWLGSRLPDSPRCVPRRIRTIPGANAIAIMLAAGVFTLSANAQQRDPRIGEWREDPSSPGYQGLYMIYEDLGNGMIRTHTAENLAPQNRLHGDQRCDGTFYPAMDSKGVPTGTSSSCTIVDTSTVAVHWIRDVEGAWAEGKGTSTLSSDGNHLTTVVEVKNRDGKVLQTNERRFTRNAENCLNHAREDLFRECQQRTAPRRN